MSGIEENAEQLINGIPKDSPQEGTACVHCGDKDCPHTTLQEHYDGYATGLKK